MQIDFNPRSREGSDKRYMLTCPRQKNFNPRSREGSDDDFKDGLVFDVISIHAPAKGATINTATVYTGDDDFNPRSREGSDLMQV